MRTLRSLAFCATLLGAPFAARAQSAAPMRAALASDSTFGALIGRLSEPAGYFDTDNLISNEASYQHVLGTLRAQNVRGGAYIGVGPDQNFAYIAQVRPQVAFIIDIRRDNLLEHLLFKSLFALAPDRAQYIALLIGRPAPTPASEWRMRTPENIADYFDAAAPSPSAAENAVAAVRRTVQTFGVPLSPQDLNTIERFHHAFITDGLGLRFTSYNRGPQPYYPTLRQLILEKDLTGRQGSYLAHDEDYQYLRQMEAKNLIVPVVGNLAGTHALAAIGGEVRNRGLAVSAFYTSNVEMYLWRDGSFPQFAATTSKLPRSPNSVIIRSFFGRYGRLPQTVQGYASTQLVEPLEAFARETDAGGYKSYMDLASKNTLANK
jgi:hypothetical protein